MSAETPRLKFAPIPEGIQVTADTWAEALDRLDALCDLYLLGQFANTPPTSPADGDAYLTGGAPGGAWTNQAYKIASCLDGQWRFYTPFNGLRAYVAPTGAFIVYLNGQWLDWNALLSANETSIASAATCDLGAANALFVQITGTTAIAGFGSGASKLRFVRFAQALTLTHNAASLILLGGASRITAPGDVGIYASDATGNWRERSYCRAAAFIDGVTTDSAGHLLLNGQTAAYSITNNNVTVTPALQLTGSGPDASILFARFAAGNAPARFTFAKSWGVTRGDFSALPDGDYLGLFSFNGADGTAFREGAWLRAMVDGAAAPGSVAGKISFGTTPAGGTIPIDWLTIRQNGYVWIGEGCTTLPACKLDIDGPVRVKSYSVAAMPGAAAGAGQIVYVGDENGGAVLAFSDGTSWRRVTDRAVVR